jgi:hypothetical protein
MSGGSYDYCYSKIEDMADSISPKTPLRKAFKKHLHLVAKACHDIEWVDSGDGADEETSMRKVLGENAQLAVLQECVIEAKRAASQLAEAIQQAQAKTGGAS